MAKLNQGKAGVAPSIIPQPQAQPQQATTGGMSVADFGRQVKSRYPQYANLSDEEVGQKTLERYPQYQSRIGQTQEQPQGPGGIGGFISGVGKTIIDAPRQFAESGARIGDYLAGSPFGQFIQKNVVNPLVGALPEQAQQGLGQFSQGVNRGVETATQQPEILERRSGAERVGETAANIGMLLAPGGIAKGVAGRLAPRLGGTLGRAAPITARGLAEGVSGATITAGQTGDLSQGAVGGALDTGLTLGLGALGTVGRGVGRSIFKAAKPAVRAATETATTGVRSLPSRFINNILRPPKSGFNFGKNPGKTVADLGIIANSEEELLTGISTKRQEIGQQIGNVIQALGTKKSIPIRSIFGPLDEAIVKAGTLRRTNQPLIARLEALRGDLRDVIGGPTRRFIDPQQTFEMKKIIGDMSSWTGQSFDSELNQARVQVYRNLKEILEDAVPDKELRRLDDIYGNLVEAENALQGRIGVSQRNNIISLPQIGFGGVGAIAAGGPGAMIGVLVSNLTGTVAFKTRVAAKLSEVFNGLDEASKKGMQELIPVIADDFAKLGPNEQEKFIDALPAIAKILRFGVTNPSGRTTPTTGQGE